MATLLLELFSEEIPSRMQRNAAEQLQRAMIAGLEKYSLALAECKTFVSPRHLAIQVFGLPVIQPDVKEERKGPKVGAPEQAMKGFLGATGLKVEQCEQRDGYYYATIERKGQPTAAVVKTVIEDVLTGFSWPKSMRWGSRPLAWVRPLHRIVCLLDDAIVPVQFAHLVASNIAEGHRFLAPQEIILANAEQYESALKSAKVVVDYAARRAQIAAEIAALASAAKLTVVADDALLDEVTGLVEWPVPLLGEFDAKFLQLPSEVLISEMKVHQRYFALQAEDGALSNKFIAVANMVTADGGKRVIAGNARVLRARLSDGEFYWDQDRKKSLREWAVGLKDVVFHAKVGMMSEKVARIETLAVEIAKAVGFADVKSVQRAAQLCKADLTSGMVGEFPELQGIMGRYYATAQGESAEVADAIRDHYLPKSAAKEDDDALDNQSILSSIVAIADKLDSIGSLFDAGEKPTGSKDPLALRRAALGIIRIVWRKGFDFDLVMLGATPEVIDFFRDRLQNLLRDDEVRHDIIEASMAVRDQAFNISAITERTRKLSRWVDSEQGKESLAAVKRTLNILAAEEKKAKATIAIDTNKIGALTLPVEKKLWELVQQVGHTKLSALETLTVPINQFFTEVLVTEPEFREARLGLLAYTRDAALSIADFSKIEG